MDWQNFTQQIKNSVNVVDVINDYVRLTKKGANWSACCPFHQEDTPSFFVNEQKQFYHCFGCGASGDIFDFLQNRERIDFVEAAKILANRAGIPWPELEKSNSQWRERLLEINKLAADFYHYVLFNLSAGKSGLDYVKNRRKMSDELLKEFKVGFAPDQKDLLLKFLKKRNYTEREMLDAGVIAGQYAPYYDRFRGRVVFPISNHLGQVVGFTGRILDDSKPLAKYLNTAQTALFNKSNLIYGLTQAKEAIRQSQQIILVEGQMDVLKAHQFAYKNVVASSGTALTTDHLRILKRYSDNLVICFDNDGAGEKATQRAIALAWPLDFKIKIIQIPESCGKDIDECLEKNPEQWKKLLAEPMSVWDFYATRWDKVGRELDDLKVIKAEFFSLLNMLGPGVDQEYFLDKYAQKYNVSFEILKEEYSKKKMVSAVGSESETKQSQGDFGTPALAMSSQANYIGPEDHALSLIIALQFKMSLEEVIAFLPLEAFTNSFLSELYKQIIIYYTNNNSKTFGHDFNQQFNNFSEFLDGDLREKAQSLYLLFTVQYEQLPLHEQKHFLSEILKNLKRSYLRKEMEKLKLRYNDENNLEYNTQLQKYLQDLNLINKYNL
jgi:DNA primase